MQGRLRWGRKECARLDRNKLIQDKDLFCPDTGAGDDFLPACEVAADYPGKLLWRRASPIEALDRQPLPDHPVREHLDRFGMQADHDIPRRARRCKVPVDGLCHHRSCNRCDSDR